MKRLSGRWIPWWFGGVVAPLLVTTLAAQAAGSSRPAPPGLTTRAISVGDLGHPEGITIYNAVESRDVYFPTAPLVPTYQAELRLRLHASLHNFNYAFVQILVNGTPRYSVALHENVDTVFEVDVPLPPEDMEGSSTHVSFRFGGRLIDDVCYDPRTNGSFVRMLPGSALVFRYAPSSVSTVAAAWDVLPRHVVVALPWGELSADAYHAAWQMGSVLERTGRRVRYLRLPAPAQVREVVQSSPGRVRAEQGPEVTADSFAFSSTPELARWLASGDAGRASAAPDRSPGLVVVAAQDELVRLLVALRGGADTVSFVGEQQDGANLRLLHAWGQPVIAVTGPFSFRAHQLLGGRWRALANAPTLRVEAAAASRSASSRGGVVAFDQLGMGGVRRDVIEVGDWDYSFSMLNLPAGRLARGVEMDVIAGLTPRSQPVVLHALLNGVLIRSVRLADHGRPQRIRFELPERLMGLDNMLRLEARRQLEPGGGPAGRGACTPVPASAPIQVLATSVVFIEDVGRPEKFYELMATLRLGYEAYLPDDYRGRPLQTLPFLARVGATALPLADLEALRFYPAGEQIRPAGRFVLVGGDTAAAAIRAPLRVRDGRIVLRAPEGSTVLDVEAHPEVTLAQVAQAGESHGLWLYPLNPDRMAPPTTMFLSQGDVALITRQGVDLSYDSRAWLRDRWLWLWRFLHHNRFILMGFGLLLFGIVTVYLLRRLRSRRARRPAAVQ